VVYAPSGKAKKIEISQEDNVAEQMCKLIKYSRNLQHLNLENTGLSERMVGFIVTSLRKSPGL